GPPALQALGDLLPVRLEINLARRHGMRDRIPGGHGLPHFGARSGTERRIPSIRLDLPHRCHRNCLLALTWAIEPRIPPAQRPPPCQPDAPAGESYQPDAQASDLLYSCRTPGILDLRASSGLPMVKIGFS